MMSQPLIDAGEVERIFWDCLTNPSEDPAECKIAEGVLHPVALSPVKLEEHRQRIEHMLTGLPLGFFSVASGGGGGWSFLMACDDRNGVQWTGLHLTMEQLFQLGQGLDVAVCLAPREMW